MQARSGRLATQVGPNVRTETLRNVVQEDVELGSVVSTDELLELRGSLTGGDGFVRGAVRHGAKEWSSYGWRGPKRSSYTNSIEGEAVQGERPFDAHIHISGEKMPKYLAEFVFRSNHRQHLGNLMLNRPDDFPRRFDGAQITASKLSAVGRRQADHLLWRQRIRIIDPIEALRRALASSSDIGDSPPLEQGLG